MCTLCHNVVFIYINFKLVNLFGSLLFVDNVMVVYNYVLTVLYYVNIMRAFGRNPNEDVVTTTIWKL